jgi:hypothetical protein
MTIKQSAPFGSHSRKGSAVTAPPVIGDCSRSCWWSSTKRDKSGDSNQLQRLPQLSAAAPPVLGRVEKSDGFPSCQQSWKKAATVTRAPPVVGNGSPSRWRSRRKAATVKRCPPVVGGVGQRQQWLPQLSAMAPPVVSGVRRKWQWLQRLPQLLATAPPVIGKVRRKQQR